MRLVLTFLLLCTLRLAAVEYIHFGGAVETNGWSIRLTNGTAPNLDATTAANTNLQFFNGFTTNNEPSFTNGLTITWTDMGWDSTGAAITRQETAYATKLLREPYPMQNTNSIYQIDTTNCVMWLASSKQISSRASNITVSIRQGAWASTNGSAFTNCMATNVTLVNESLQNYRRPFGNFSPGSPMFSRVTNTMRVRVIGFHQSAQDFQPVALVRIITTGLTSGVKVTNDVTRWSVDHAYNSRATFPKLIDPAEAIADVDLSGMTALETVRTDFQIFPHNGDTILDTTLDTFPVGHPPYSAVHNLYDPNNAHSTVIAVVDNVNGNDTNGRCQTNTIPQDINSAQYFLTTGAALDQCARSNLTFYGHSNTSGVIIYNRSTVTNYPGTAPTVVTIPVVAPIIRNYPGETPILTHRIAANGGDMKRVKFEGISMAWASGQIPFLSYGFVWSDQCPSITSVSTGPITTTTNVIFTHSKIGSFAQGLKARANEASAFSVRGCWLDGYDQVGVFRTWMGNYHGTTNEGNDYSIVSGASGDLSPEGNRILYNNYFGGQHSTVILIEMHSNRLSQVAVVQNVFEKCRSGEVVANIATAGGSAWTNYLDWHNLYEGGRIADYASFADETAVIHRVGFSVKNTIWSYPGQKMDTDGTPNAQRWHNSAQASHMVDCEGVFYIRNNVANIPPPSSFRPIYAGMNTFENSNSNVNNYARFTDRQAAVSGVSPLGGGDYRLLNDSPVFRLKTAKVLPFDIEGKPRSAIDPPGPYSAGNPKKRSMF